ncbi:MAG: hypothetical protein WC352_08340, partial [Candidatus Omnitrophota bacterium]
EREFWGTLDDLPRPQPDKGSKTKMFVMPVFENQGDGKPLVSSASAVKSVPAYSILFLDESKDMEHKRGRESELDRPFYAPPEAYADLTAQYDDQGRYKPEVAQIDGSGLPGKGRDILLMQNLRFQNPVDVVTGKTDAKKEVWGVERGTGDLYAIVKRAADGTIIEQKLIARAGTFQLSVPDAGGVMTVATIVRWTIDPRTQDAVAIRPDGTREVLAKRDTFRYTAHDGVDGAGLPLLDGLYIGSVCNWEARLYSLTGMMMNPFKWGAGKRGKGDQEKLFFVATGGNGQTRTRKPSGHGFANMNDIVVTSPDARIERVRFSGNAAAVEGELSVPVATLPSRTVEQMAPYWRIEGDRVVIPADGWYVNAKGEKVLRGAHSPWWLAMEEAESGGRSGYLLNTFDGWHEEVMLDALGAKRRVWVRRDKMDPRNPIIGLIDPAPSTRAARMGVLHTRIDHSTKKLVSYQILAEQGTFGRVPQARTGLEEIRSKKYFTTQRGKAKPRSWNIQEVVFGEGGVILREGDFKVIGYREVAAGSPDGWRRVGDDLVFYEDGAVKKDAKGRPFRYPIDSSAVAGVTAEELFIDRDGLVRYKERYDDQVIARQRADGNWDILAPEAVILNADGEKTAVMTDRSKKEGLDPNDTEGLGISVDASGDLIVKRFHGNVDEMQVDPRHKDEGWLVYRSGDRKGQFVQMPTGATGADAHLRFGYFAVNPQGEYVRSSSSGLALEAQYATQVIIQHDNKNGLYGQTQPRIVSRAVYDFTTDMRWMMFQEYLEYTNPWTGLARGVGWAQRMLNYIAISNFYMYGEGSAYGKMDLLAKMYWLNLILRRFAPAGFRCHDFREAQAGPVASLFGTMESPIWKTEETGIGEIANLGRQLSATGWIGGDAMALYDCYYPFEALMHLFRGDPKSAAKTMAEGYKRVNILDESGFSLEGRKHISLLLRGFISEPNFLFWVLFLGLLATLIPGLLTAMNAGKSMLMFGAVMLILIKQKSFVIQMHRIFVTNDPIRTLGNVAGVTAVVVGLIGLYSILPFSSPAFHIGIYLAFLLQKRILWKPTFGRGWSLASSYWTGDGSYQSTLLKRVLIFGAWVAAISLAAFLLHSFIALPFVQGMYATAVNALYSAMSSAWVGNLTGPPVMAMSSSYAVQVVGGFLPSVPTGAYWFSYYLVPFLLFRFAYTLMREISKGLPKAGRDERKPLWRAVQYLRDQVTLSYRLMEDENRSNQESLRHTSTLLRLLLVRSLAIVAAIVAFLAGKSAWNDLRVLNAKEAAGPSVAEYYSPKLNLLLPLQVGLLILAGVMFGLLDPALFWKGFPIFIMSWIFGGIEAWLTSNSGGAHHYEPLAYQGELASFEDKRKLLQIQTGGNVIPVSDALRLLDEATKGPMGENSNVDRYNKEVPDRDRVRIFFRHMTDLDIQDPDFRAILERHIADRMPLNRDEDEDLPIYEKMKVYWSAEWDKLPDLVRLEILNDLWLDEAARPHLRRALKLREVPGTDDEVVAEQRLRWINALGELVKAVGPRQMGSLGATYWPNYTLEEKMEAILSAFEKHGVAEPESLGSPY